jgi:hypothetical protein
MLVLSAASIISLLLSRMWGVKEGRSPSLISFPLSFEGEGDKGGEVDK